MKITFLGTSHGKPEKDRFCTSTVLTVNGKHYIIDAGAPLADLLLRYDIAPEHIAGIFVTHLHIDHIAGLPHLTAMLNSKLRFFDVNFPVLLPEISRAHAIFELIHGSRELSGRLDYRQYESGEIFDNGEVRISAIPTGHCPHSHAFHIEAEGKSVVFTGDLKKDLSDYPAIITEAEEPHDLVVMEAAHQHYWEPYVEQVLSQSHTRRMIVHHVAELRNSLEVIEATLSKLRFPATIAYDGMVTEL